MTTTDLGQSATRARLARELHDGIAQDLVAVGYSLDLLLADPQTTVGTRSQLRTLRFTVTDLIEKVRREIYFLRQPSTMTISDGIKNTAQTLCTDFETQMDIDHVALPFDSALSYEIHKIAQEILRNIVAHAKAKTVQISLSKAENILELHISDDGIGGAQSSATHYGIQGIRDRASAINGTIEIKSNANGTRMWLRVPIEEHASI